MLPLPAGLHPRPHLGRGLGHHLVRQLLVLHAGHLDEDVDAVQQGAGDAVLVARDR